MRVAVIGRTKALLDAARALSAAGHEIPVVWTCSAEAFYGVNEEEFKELANELEADFYNDVAINSEENMARIASYRCDVAISVNWLTVIGSGVLKLFTHGVLNAHAGDLPRYRGNACPNWAIIMGEPYVAVCIHQMAVELDAGPVVKKDFLPLDDKVDMTSVCEWLDQRVPQMFVEAVGSFADGSARPEPQSENTDLALRVYPRRPEDSKLDWSWSCDRVLRMIRASTRPYSGAYSYLEKERKVTIWRAAKVMHPGPFLAVPGQVCYRLDGDPVVACVDGVIRLLDVEVEGISDIHEAKKLIARSLRNRLTT